MSWVPTAKRPGLPDGPNVPGLVTAVGVVKAPTKYLRWCHKHWGPNFTITLPGDDKYIVVTDPEVIRATFRASPSDLHAGEGNAILRPIVGDLSILLLDEDEHKRDRKLLMPPFHGERMRQYGTRIGQAITEAIDKLEVGVTVTSHHVFQEVTLDVILEVVFGVQGAQKSEFKDALIALLTFGDRPEFLMLIDGDGYFRSPKVHQLLGNISPVTAFQECYRTVQKLLEDEVHARRSDGKYGDDIFSMLLQAQYEDGSYMEAPAIRDELITMLLAGHETTATSLTWQTWWISQYPGVRQAILKEVRDIGAGKAVAPEHVNDLAFTTATIKESMRRRPVIPFVARKAKKDLVLAGMHVPKGATVFPSMYLTHHREDLWDEPDSFSPWRFLGKNPPSDQFFPFGGGNRTCLGLAFAYYEMKIVLSEFVRRVSYKTPDGYTPKVVRRNITFSPSEGVPITITDIRD